MSPGERKGPAANGASSKSLAGDGSILPSSNGRRYWARQLIDRASSPVPAYGSTDWLMLATDDPAKVASCVTAAECWATSGDTLEADLRREIEAMQVAFKAGEDAEYRQRANEHRERYGSAAGGKSFAERRAAQLASVAARPGDYPGKRGGAK